MNQPACPLCHSSADVQWVFRKKAYLSCSSCKGIFMTRHDLPADNEELLRYQEHNNDVNDSRYQKFVEPIVTSIRKDFHPKDTGLDFGAGTGPVISKMLTDLGYDIKPYDPFFHNHPDLLRFEYDYIACCEVVEHFHDPRQEFLLLKRLLRDGGKLYIKTAYYHPGLDFEKWHYKDDPTHVFFYQKETLEFIRHSFGFADLTFVDGIAILTKNESGP